ncbi:MAG: 50S ribosomal protein L34 [Candidatus Levybacteria bacterium]|nr:50S ribosomal protein L34 [Candidatus Levybacteria bacterium]
MEKLRKLKKIKRQRKHGFLHRTKSANGKKTLKKRRVKGRSRLTI